ncbi:MAG TPA: GPW/gp25 family protein [Aquabacterium sp.]|uniref:GPW/gp25 family protein n=1 Tax=Aquabacterium sp. TaxID=1872578 RepID=UPI002DA146A7|nr:GPW/gp25 family protein [Aquabacterium sp.]HET6787898.1 GPW/gp25 family protein [Aquabacterium sp.]HEX5373063.1 GPW/gp25 family protein [Aquabacterium sp.]
MISTLHRFDRLGQGLGQPIAPDAQGRLPLVSGPDKVRQSIFTILDTEPGERVMRPDFGCGLRRYLMQPNNPGTRAGIGRDITNALTRWESRIKVTDVTVTPTDDRSMVLIEIRYAHVLDGRQDILVYPFYLEQA